MTNAQISSAGWIALELSLITGAIITTGWTSYILLGMYAILPVVSGAVMLMLLRFMSDPPAHIMRKGKDGTVTVDLTPFIYYKDIYSRITNASGTTDKVYWLMDAAVLVICLGLASQGYTDIPFIILFLAMTETAIREWFVSTVIEKGEYLDEVFDAMSKALAELEKEDEEGNE